MGQLLAVYAHITSSSLKHMYAHVPCVFIISLHDSHIFKERLQGQEDHKGAQSRAHLMAAHQATRDPGVGMETIRQGVAVDQDQRKEEVVLGV